MLPRRSASLCFSSSVFASKGFEATGAALTLVKSSAMLAYGSSPAAAPPPPTGAPAVKDPAPPPMPPNYEAPPKANIFAEEPP